MLTPDQDLLSQNASISTLEFALTSCRSLDPQSPYGKLIRWQVENIQGEPRGRLMSLLEQLEGA